MAFKTNADIQNGEYGQWIFDRKTKSWSFDPMGKAVIIETITDNLETGVVTFMLSFDFLGEKKYFEATHKILADSTFVNDLIDAGADVTKKTFPVFVDTLRLQEYDMEANGIAAEKVYSKLGWKTCRTPKGSVLCYRASTMIGGSGRYIGNLKVAPMGSFQKWQDLVKQDVLGHTPLEIVLLAGLSAVVNGIISSNTTGENPIFHIMGVSGSGKSTAGILCASVSGEPFDGEKQTYDQHGIPQSWLSVYGSWSATENATVARCAGNRGSVIVLNELGKYKGKDLSTLVYNMSEGTDKLRLTKTLDTKLSEGYSTAIVSIGEHSLLDRCLSKADGLRSRVMELDCPMTTSAEQADRIKSVCRRNNGFAAPMLADYILKNGGIKGVLDVYDCCRQSLLEKWPDTPSRERFISKFPALLLTTAILSEAALGITFDQQAIEDFFVQYDLSHGELRNVAAASYDVVIEQCRIHSNKFVKRKDKSMPRNAYSSTGDTEPNQECWGRITQMKKQHVDGRWILEEMEIRKSVLENILVSNGFDNKKTCIDEWKKAGVLNFEDEHHPCRARTINGSSEKLYVLRVFATDDEAAEIQEEQKQQEKLRLKPSLRRKSSQLASLLDDNESEVKENA